MAITLSPPPYDHKPQMEVVRRFTKDWTVNDFPICKTYGENVLACARVIDGICYEIISTAGWNQHDVALIIRHEDGHCNGWPANHPNGHYE